MENNAFTEQIKGIRELLETRFDYNDRHHTEMLKQVKETNGRVNKLENWRSYIAGGLAILTILFLPIIFIVINLFLKG